MAAPRSSVPPGSLDVVAPAPPPRIDPRDPLRLPPRPLVARPRARWGAILGGAAVAETSLAALAIADVVADPVAAIAMALTAVAGLATALRGRRRARSRPALPAPPVTDRATEASLAAPWLPPGATDATAELSLLDAAERLAVARALAAADRPGPLLAALADDEDEDVRAAALRSLAALARAGSPIPAAVRDRVAVRERERLAALLAVRPAPGAAPALHVAEVDRALRATADRVRELALADPAFRDAVEQAMRTPVSRVSRALVEPWLAALLAGEHVVREPAIAALRACPLFDELPGRHADDLAARAGRRYLAAGDVLFRRGEPAGALYVVVSGALALAGGEAPAAPLPPGTALGTAALADPPSARDVTARATTLTELLVVDRATFALARHRWPWLAAPPAPGAAHPSRSAVAAPSEN